MSYRKITVNGTVYRYVIGKQMTKVRELGVFKNEDYGVPMTGGEVPSGEFPSPDRIFGYQITPVDVRQMILFNTKGTAPRRREHFCRNHGYLAKTLTSCPYASEIQNSNYQMWNCPSCVHESWMET